MTDEERSEEGAEEPIEDLEAPAQALQDVAGGAGACSKPSCNATVECSLPTCAATEYVCKDELGSRNHIEYAH